MTDAVNDKLVAGRFVENQVRIRIDQNATDAPLAAQRRGVGILQYQIDDRLNARLHTKRALRGFQLDIS